MMISERVYRKKRRKTKQSEQINNSIYELLKLQQSRLNNKIFTVSREKRNEETNAESEKEIELHSHLH